MGDRSLHAPMSPVAHRVAKVTVESEGVRTLELEAVEGDAAVNGRPGQFSMLYGFGVGEVPISYSRTDTARAVHTIMSVGAVSDALVKMEVGDTVGVRGPFGTAWPLEQAKGRDVVVIAGGIGLAPLRPLVCHLLAHRDDFGDITLICGARSPDRMLYRGELDEWASTGDIEVLLTVDALAADSHDRSASSAPAWTGHVGVVTELIARVNLEREGALAMMCGPEVMFRFCVRALIDRGVAPDDLFVSMERNMKCATGHCGRCQWGAEFVCKDGPVFCYERIARLFTIPEV